MSKLTASCKLKLTPEDVKYIIVKEQSEIREVMGLLNRTYSNPKYYEQLYSKILTVRQIKEDF